MIFIKCGRTFKVPGYLIANRIYIHFKNYGCSLFLYKPILAYKIIFIYSIYLFEYLHIMCFLFIRSFTLYSSLSKNESLCFSCLLPPFICVCRLGAPRWLCSISYEDISVNNFNENIWCINITNLGSKWWDGGKRNK